MSTETREALTSTPVEWHHINAAVAMPPPGSLAMSMCGTRFRTRGRRFTSPLPDHCPLCVAVWTELRR